MTFSYFLLCVAAILFLLAGVGVPSKVNLVALGLFLWIVAVHLLR